MKKDGQNSYLKKIKNYNILTYYGSNLGIPLKVSPSVIASEDQIKFFFESLDKTLKIGFYKLLLDFTKNKILNKVKGNLI